MHASIVERLLESDEPSVRWKVRTHVLGEEDDPGLREEIRRSDRVRRLLAACGPVGVYAKWQGAQWALAALALPALLALRRARWPEGRRRGGVYR